jgi:hypothetical protein
MRDILEDSGFYFGIIVLTGSIYAFIVIEWYTMWWWFSILLIVFGLSVWYNRSTSSNYRSLFTLGLIAVGLCLASTAAIWTGLYEGRKGEVNPPPREHKEYAMLAFQIGVVLMGTAPVFLLTSYIFPYILLPFIPKQKYKGGKLVKMEQDDGLQVLNDNSYLTALAKIDPDLAGKLQANFNHYNPGSGGIRSWAGTWRGKKRVELLEVLNQEQQLLLEQATMFARQVQDGKRSQWEFATYVANSKRDIAAAQAEAELHTAAHGNKMTIDDFSSLTKEQQLSKIRMEEEEKRHKLSLERERELAKIKREQDTQKSSSDLENEIKLANAEIDFAVKADSLTKQQQVRLIQNMIDELYDEIEQIEQSSQSATMKQRKIADREEIIQSLVKKRNETAN